MYNKIINSLIFIIAIFIISIVLYISLNHAFYGDDYTFGLLNYKEGIFDSLYKTAGQEHGGGYFSLFLNKFLSFGLPYILHIHPADFICYGEGIIQGIITVLLCLSYVKFISESKNNKFLFLSLFAFFCIFYFYLIAYSRSYYSLTGVCTFYRYQLTLLFFNVFIYNIYKNITNPNNKFNIVNFIITIFASIFIGCNNELLAEITLITMFEITLYNIIIKIISWKKKEIKSFLLNLNIVFWMSFATLIISTILFATSVGFSGLISYRIVPNYNEILINASEFLQEFIKLYFKNAELWWIIFIIILVLAIKKAYKKSELKEVFIAVFIQLGNIITIISLAIGGKTLGETFWLFRPTIKFSFLMIFLIVLLMITDNIIKSAVPKTKTKLIYGLISILIILSILIAPKLKYLTTLNKTDVSIVYKKFAYIGEKMLRFYYLKNETPYLINFDYKKYANEDYPSLYSKTDFVKTPDLCTKENLYTLTYYPKIYKDNKSIELGLCYSDDALERFYKKGGQFNKEEFEPIIFSRLLDDDFVLNKNATSQEINDNNFKALEIEKES